MSEKLLLPGAKSAILLDTPRPSLSPWWRRGALVFGLVAVLSGSADVIGRLGDEIFVLPDDVAFTAFAPVALVIDPSLNSALQSTTTAPLVPTRISIGSIGVDASVEQVGKTPEGAMATPKALANVGWYSLGAKPGGAGNAVFAGHVNNSLGLPGVFKELSEVKKGDTVEVRGTAGETLVYEVESIDSYAENAAPLAEIFSTTGQSKLVLITCEGTWDETTHTFDKRLVVVARLV